MKAKGSITIMLCLTLTIMTALVAAGFRSVQNASARAVAAGGQMRLSIPSSGNMTGICWSIMSCFFWMGPTGGTG